MEFKNFIFEILVTLCFVFLQLIYFYRTRKEIKNFKSIFPSKTLDSSLIIYHKTISGSYHTIDDSDKSFSDDFKSILSDLNKYLSYNYGSTDFNLIKSIVERYVTIKENNSSANITLPLYIGLMGTFFGVILGLVRIAFVGGVTEGNISHFIGGVIIAMTASLCGLILTVINNSWNFRKAKQNCDNWKNSFYNFLQIELLPYFENSIIDALNTLRVHITDFNFKFGKNLEKFDSIFSDKINILQDAVLALSDNIQVVIDNTKTQKDFLIELKTMEYEKMAQANIKVFTLIKEAEPTFIRFIKSSKDLSDSIINAGTYVGTIENILNRVKSFEEGINKLGENINTNQFLGNEVLVRIDKNLKYLDTQFALLQQHENRTTDEINNFFTLEYKKIQDLVFHIKREIENALNLNIEDNPFLKLNYLEPVYAFLSEINEKINLNGGFKSIDNNISESISELLNIRQSIEQLPKDNNINSSFKKNSNEIEEIKQKIEQLNFDIKELVVDLKKNKQSKMIIRNKKEKTSQLVVTPNSKSEVIKNTSSAQPSKSTGLKRLFNFLFRKNGR
jgi:hypothetical protein